MFWTKKKQESKERKIGPFDLEEILIELPEIQSKQFDQAIESAFRFGDFDAIYKLIHITFRALKNNVTNILISYN